MISQKKNATWSKEIYKIFKPHSSQGVFKFEEFIDLVDARQKDELLIIINSAIDKHHDFHFETKMTHGSGETRWYKIIGKYLSEDNELSGIIIDINDHKASENKIKELNSKLIEAARKAGMAEVATTILHNIGNVLNSTISSLDILLEAGKKPYADRVVKVSELINQNIASIEDYLNNDQKGKLVPGYLTEISKILKDEEEKRRSEVVRLSNNIQHIAEIVSMQNMISGTSSMLEEFYLGDVIDTAIEMTINTKQYSAINIQKKFEQNAIINADKSKVLQIIVNLLG